jgi:hypothetical protein
MPPSTKPSLRFFHSVPLRTRTTKVLARVEGGEDPTRHSAALADLVLDLTEEGLGYYFLKPVREGKFGFIARKTAGVGLAGAMRMMSPIVRSVIGGASAPQLRVIARHIRHLMA